MKFCQTNFVFAYIHSPICSTRFISRTEQVFFDTNTEDPTISEAESSAKDLLSIVQFFKRILTTRLVLNATPAKTTQDQEKEIESSPLKKVDRKRKLEEIQNWLPYSVRKLKRRGNWYCDVCGHGPMTAGVDTNCVLCGQRWTRFRSV